MPRYLLTGYKTGAFTRVLRVKADSKEQAIEQAKKDYPDVEIWKGIDLDDKGSLSFKKIENTKK